MVLQLNFGNEKNLVKVREGPGCWLNIDKVNTDLQHEKGCEDERFKKRDLIKTMMFPCPKSMFQWTNLNNKWDTGH